MSYQPVAVPTDSGVSTTSSMFAGKLQYLHVAMEVLVIGIVYYLLNRKVTSLQGDLVECAVRIAAQNKKIAELESKMEEMTDALDAINRRSMASMMMPPMAPVMPRSQPMMSSFQSFPGSGGFQPPVVPSPVVPVPQASQPANIAVAAGSEPVAQQPAAVTPDELDTQLAAELKELSAPADN